MNYYLGNPTGFDFNTLIDLSNTKDFSKIDCSAVKLLDYWRNSETVLNIIKKRFNIDNNINFEICFEYPVSSLGKARASFSDIMLISDEYMIGIEAKYSENRYPDCEKWISMGKDKNFRIDVLNHWLSIINNAMNSNIKIEDIIDIEYQLIHRTASVLSKKKNNYILLYQIFQKDKKSSFKQKDDMIRLKKLFNNDNIIFACHNIIFNDSEKYSETEKFLDNKISISERSEIIKNAIKKAELIEIIDDKNIEIF